MELRFDNGESEINEQFYVGIESIEEVEGGNFQIVFDGVRKADFERYGGSDLRKTFGEVVPHLFFIVIKPSFFSSFIGLLQSRLYLSRWLLLNTSDSQTLISATVIIDNFSELQETQMFISSITPISAFFPVSRQLNKYFSWDKDYYTDIDAIEYILNNINHSNCIHKLNVYDVGQGSLSAVTDQFNKPLFYFDLGGGFGFNKKTYPDTLKLCFSKTRTVVLSHWDLDHVETARRYLNENRSELNGLILIAPEQTVTTYYYNLVARLAAAGVKLYLWKKSIKPSTIKFWAGSLIRCIGPEKNHNGIALIVESLNNSIEKVLHPGDAAYRYIPGSQNFNLDGLVATHHGANFDVNNGPIPQITEGAIAYSHGDKYGHPTVESVNDHHAAGWTNRLETFSGKISSGGHISFTTNLKYRNPPRSGKICGLRNFQSF